MTSFETATQYARQTVTCIYVGEFGVTAML